MKTKLSIQYGPVFFPQNKTIGNNCPNLSKHLVLTEVIVNNNYDLLTCKLVILFAINVFSIHQLFDITFKVPQKRYYFYLLIRHLRIPNEYS